MDLQMIRETDFLYGIVSYADIRKHNHYFMADLDDVDEKEVIERLENLMLKYACGNLYLMKTGKGFHIVTFSKPIPLETYISMLIDIQADPKYIEWVSRVKYGVLRLSRRSSHMNVPVLTKVFISPHKYQEDTFKKLCYKNILDIEYNIKEVKRIKVESKERWFENDRCKTN